MHTTPAAVPIYTNIIWAKVLVLNFKTKGIFVLYYEQLRDMNLQLLTITKHIIKPAEAEGGYSQMTSRAEWGRGGWPKSIFFMMRGGWGLDQEWFLMTASVVS